jgi:arsenite-transporting ATPase
LLLELTQNRRILFFGGKGGVGKTTVSAATALAAAAAGKKVLLVSTDPAHNLGHLFDRKIGSKPIKVAAGLDAIELDPVESVELHMEEVRTALHQLMPVGQHKEIDKHMTLSRDAPGMQEAAILEKIAEVVEQGTKDYDLVVFDTAPSGHTARLMVLPEMMSAWTEGLLKRREKADKFAEVVRDLGRDSSMEDKLFGDPAEKEKAKESKIRQILLRRKNKFATLRDKLADSNMTSFIIVLAAERLPVLETIELHEQLERGGISVDGLVVNKRAPKNSGEFLEERAAQEEAHLTTLTRALPSIPRQDLYLIAQDVVGLAALEAFSKSL